LDPGEKVVVAVEHAEGGVGRVEDIGDGGAREGVGQRDGQEDAGEAREIWASILVLSEQQ
jgi:hypothetical protein